MQLVDSKLYISSIQPARDELRSHASGGRLVSRLQATSASQRVLALVLVAFALTCSPALMTTLRSTVYLSFQILFEAGHAGLIAFQIFGR
jgi:hypothetical protein